MEVTVADAASRLDELLAAVADAPVTITSPSGRAVLVDAAEFESWRETIYLLSSPANALALMESQAQVERGEVHTFAIDELLAQE